MAKLKLSASDLDRISEVLAATERSWRASRDSVPASYIEDTGYFTIEELKLAPVPRRPRKNS